MAEHKTISTANRIDMDKLQEPKITIGHNASRVDYSSH